MNFIDAFIKKHPTRTIVVGNNKRSYLVGGKGATALFILPGSGQDALSCFDLIDAFETKYKVIAINYDHLRKMQEFYDYVNVILKTEHIKTLYLYGLSVGGFLAQHYVRQYKDNVSKVIISHAGTTRSKTIINKVAIPGKILHFFLPIIPITLFRNLLTKIEGRVQSGQKDIKKLYSKYATREYLERRMQLFKKTGVNFLTRDYIESIYHLGIDMEKKEKHFTSRDLSDWKGKLLIIRTDNDPLAQDDGVFKRYYPTARVISFNETGHLTPFFRFDEMTQKIQNFLN
ncbi:MAG: alpha/beta hydrolase [Patescibacteria group bacterium]